MDTKSKPIYGCLQYPHVDFETEHNPNMDVSQIIAYHLTCRIFLYDATHVWIDNAPTYGYSVNRQPTEPP